MFGVNGFYFILVFLFNVNGLRRQLFDFWFIKAREEGGGGALLDWLQELDNCGWCFGVSMFQCFDALPMVLACTALVALVSK